MNLRNIVTEQFKNKLKDVMATMSEAFISFCSFEDAKRGESVCILGGGCFMHR